ncbi:uncharacterized protein LOC120626232 [Pararge aegeria]|uniref:uncharacterized protein LOC120626232 n=1 Tax=Pararge aegeria TaxID=116150 RepID=UPI0019D12CD2|nr:uncharacterized protein LOC120626232 [Pararge aegeria]
MDRLNQLRGDAGDSTLDTSSPPSEAFMSANESSSKYFSLSEVDSTFSISPSKDTSSTTAESERTIAAETDIIPNLSPIPKTDIETFKIGKHIEAANILSGGVNIFDDNDNSYDGDELVIDDNVVLEDDKEELKLSEGAAVPLEKDTTEDTLVEPMDEEEAIPSKDTEVVLQIDGKNVDAIDIGNRLYLYRKAGEKELSAVQIVDDDQQQPSFKFLKVRENSEGNLEVYEEIQIEIPKEVPTRGGISAEKTLHVPVSDINKVFDEPSQKSNKVIDKVNKTPNIESIAMCATSEAIDIQSESRSEVNLNGKMMKFNESRKSPLTFTPMTYHSTPNKEGIPLTKTMVDQQLHPSRHSDNIKKTIEVHTDSNKPKNIEEATITTLELNETTKKQKQDTVMETEDEGNNQMTILEHRKRETETVSNELKVDVLYNNSDEVISNNEGSPKAAKRLEETEVISEPKVECKRVPEENKPGEIKNTNEDTITSQSLVAKKANESNKSTEIPLKQENILIMEAQPVKKNIDVNNFSEDLMQKKTDKNKESNHIQPKLPEKVIPSSPPMFVDDKKVASDNKVIKDDKCDESNHSQSNEIEDTRQLIAPNIGQTFTKELKLTSTSDTTHSNTKNAEKISVQETKKDVVAMKNTISDLTTNPKTNAANKVNKDDKIKMGNSDIMRLKTDKDTAIKSNKPHGNVFQKDNVAFKKEDLRESIPSTRAEPQIDNTIFYKDTKNNSINIGKQRVFSVASTREDPKSQTTFKTNLDFSKVNSKNTNITQTILSKPINPLETAEVIPRTTVVAKSNNSNDEVPFGKWTEENRQEFLNKIKETKVPTNHSNTNQIKQTNDLNRRDVLKKFDSQRQSNATAPTKISEFSSMPKFSSKMETAAFVNKSAVHQFNPAKPVISPLKTKTAQVKPTPTVTKKDPEEEEKEVLEQRIIINSQELIDNTIEGIITRALKIKTTTPVHMKEKMTIHTVENPKDALPLPGSLDDIEMKMNELHGFSFMERSAQELQGSNHDSKSYNKLEDVNINKNIKIPNLLPFKIKEAPKDVKEAMRDDTSDEEVLEHEPITGDIDASKQHLISLLSCKETFSEPKSDAIITEKDFDKFARGNSISYEHCLTVKFDGKEKHNVVKTVVEKEVPVKKLTRNELLLAESKAKSFNKQNSAARHNNQTSKIPTLKMTGEEEPYNKNYQSRVQIAYQSALTAKRNLECPIPMIEDKPVKVVFMDTNTEFTPMQLNVQGQELSPSKNRKTECDTHSTSESLDSDIVDSILDTKPQDERSKSKHQRKQVLTPVEPEMQLIEPCDLGIKVSPKKRKTEEKIDKNIKNLVPKKSYLLNRSVDELTSKSDQPNTEPFPGHNINTAIDNLVKAAELIENQSESNGTNLINSATELPQNTPIKRGRGRPRKYPLPESGLDTNKTPSPQKKPRLIDAKPPKSYSDSEESSDGEIIKENWTMGKIDENIVCPICSKLFRSEDVLFKHVKHCTGPSPNRSDSDKRRLRDSQESDRKLRDSRSDDTDNMTDTEEKSDNEGETIKNRYNSPKQRKESEEVIILEDTPIKQKPTDEKAHHPEAKKFLRKSKPLHNTNLVCEFCGKTFRQLSYLVSHKLQHKREDQKELKQLESDTAKNSVFNCEICKKEFRKLHHLVQHRLIHNPSSTASRSLRKNSAEVHESKTPKTQNDDTSAGFRCEPCDKSFRKLHHLVEHRETHDGINKRGQTTASQSVTETSKSMPTHSCDVCKKVFKKLQDLLEHKEQHYETSSEKSDDKSVKSSLSTKDIIHECSLCYMVFPNEHSLTKHTVICLRKKKQSAAKQAAKQAEVKEGEETPDAENVKIEDDTTQVVQLIEDTPNTEESDVKETSACNVKVDQVEQNLEEVEDLEDLEDVKEHSEKTKQDLVLEPHNDVVPKKRHSNATDKTMAVDNETPAKIKKVEDKDHVIILDTPTPKKKSIKDKVASTVTKRHKTVNSPLLVIDNVKPTESSDDDEIRYMLNPNFKEEESSESKFFMKIRALKRSSLQIERPSSKDLLTRRISLQHPPKMPRLKAKAVEPKPKQDQERSKVTAEKKLKPITELTIDSDDSDVKYSFPEQETKPVEKKVKRQSAGAKRKSLVGIAKRKSHGKTVMPQVKPKRRTAEVEHRCDCGQLFSSAALLSRHTTLAHTPPRIRKRRSPPPETTNTKPDIAKPAITKPAITKPAITKPTITKPAITKPAITKPSITKSAITKPANTKPTNTKPINKRSKPDVTNSNKTLGVATRKSSVNSEMKSDSGKSVKSDSFKLLRSSKSVTALETFKKLEKKK